MIACDDAMTAEVVAVTKELIKCSLLVPTGRDAGTQLEGERFHSHLDFRLQSRSILHCNAHCG